MSDFAKFLIKAYLRKGLAMLGTFLVTRGLIDGDSNSFVSTYLEPVSGTLLVGGSLAWTTIYQWYVKRKVSKALELPKDSTPKQLEKALEVEAKG